MNKTNSNIGYSWNEVLIITFVLSVFWVLMWNYGGNFGVQYSHEIFLGVLGASATILAIAYSFSQYVFSRFSEQYSPFIQKYFNQHLKFRLSFLLLYVVILLSVFSLSVEPGKLDCTLLDTKDLEICLEQNKFSNQFKSGLIYTNVLLFVFAMYSFTLYFLQMLKFMNPMEFSTIITDMGKKRLKKIPLSEFTKKTVSERHLRDFNELSNIIASIGDTAVKLQLRHENNLANLYLESLRDLSLSYIEIKNECESLDDVELYSNIELTNNPIFLTISQLTRFFKLSYKNEEEDTSKKIISIGEDILTQLIKNKKNNYLIQLFTSDQRINPFFYTILNLISNDKNVRKEKLALIKSIFRLINLCRDTSIDFKYVDNFIPTCLFDMTKIMIDNDDLVSYRYFIQESIIWVHADPTALTSQIEEEIHLGIIDSKVDQIINDMDLKYKIKISTNINFESCKDLIADIVEFGRRLSLCQLPLEQSILINNLNKIIDKIWYLYIVSLIFKSIFWIGAYVLFKKPSPEYLDLFWNVNTSEENRMFWTNRPLISEDRDWNILFYFFENQKQVVHSFDLFRDPYLNLEKFFLMTLIKSNEDFPLKLLYQNDIFNSQLTQKSQSIQEILSICKTIKTFEISEKLKKFKDKNINNILKVSNFMSRANSIIEEIKIDIEKVEQTLKKN